MVEDTSLEAYRHLNLNKREQLVIDALRAQLECPTSYELAHWMYDNRTAVDLNSTRPRLTDLKNAGVVEKVSKRPCKITGNTCYTWRIIRDI